MTIKIGVLLPNLTPDPGQPILGDVRASARLAEEMGPDRLVHRPTCGERTLLDSTVVLATAAAGDRPDHDRIGVMLLALGRCVGREADQHPAVRVR